MNITLPRCGTCGGTPRTAWAAPDGRLECETCYRTTNERSEQ